MKIKVLKLYRDGTALVSTRGLFRLVDKRTNTIVEELVDGAEANTVADTSAYIDRQAVYEVVSYQQAAYRQPALYSQEIIDREESPNPVQTYHDNWTWLPACDVGGVSEYRPPIPEREEQEAAKPAPKRKRKKKSRK